MDKEMFDMWDKVKASWEGRSFNKQLVVSPEAFKTARELPEFEAIPIMGIPIQSTPWLPFEKMYDACDIETKAEVKIPSGVWIHGIMISDSLSRIPSFSSSIGLICESALEKRGNPYLEYLRERMYGRFYPFINFESKE